MTCSDIAAQDLLEEHVAGRLSGAGRDGLEAHLFECPACLRDVETLQDLRDELAVSRASAGFGGGRFVVPLLATAAVVSLAVGIAWQSRRPAPDPALTQIARVAPPVYTPFTVRGGDEGVARFDRAMDAYRGGNFVAAAHELRQVVASDPHNVQAAFYLGASLLLTGSAGDALAPLQAVIAAGQSPFFESARVLHAKALVQTGDLDGADRELVAASRGDTPRAREAADLLRQLRAVRGRH